MNQTNFLNTELAKKYLSEEQRRRVDDELTVTMKAVAQANTPDEAVKAFEGVTDAAVGAYNLFMANLSMMEEDFSPHPLPAAESMASLSAFMVRGDTDLPVEAKDPTQALVLPLHIVIKSVMLASVLSEAGGARVDEKRGTIRMDASPVEVGLAFLASRNAPLVGVMMFSPKIDNDGVDGDVHDPEYLASVRDITTLVMQGAAFNSDGGEQRVTREYRMNDDGVFVRVPDEEIEERPHWPLTSIANPYDGGAQERLKKMLFPDGDADDPAFPEGGDQGAEQRHVDGLPRRWAASKGSIKA